MLFSAVDSTQATHSVFFSLSYNETLFKILVNESFVNELTAAGEAAGSIPLQHLPTEGRDDLGPGRSAVQGMQLYRHQERTLFGSGKGTRWG